MTSEKSLSVPGLQIPILAPDSFVQKPKKLLQKDRGYLGRKSILLVPGMKTPILISAFFIY